ncbi:MAG: tRNA (adenosine(37)-N6)-threonylcarbamoyltransferase complex dimerization subunit type 1 TsaB [Pirellulales bacterium]|nr:tRNA (adenosine(37)-N6)-threonylcarbamoyltransferase complex dimerization subunit type 1 TsaB [Pirellulales bacterium]
MSLRTLAVETSHPPGSIACLVGDQVQDSLVLPLRPPSGITLAPAIDRLLQQLGWRSASLDLLAVATGPGSFTGLRIGVTLAKTLAYGLRIPVLGVLTTDAIATQVADHLKQSGKSDSSAISVAIDALRQQVFQATYHLSGSAWAILGNEKEPQLLSIAAWLDHLSPGTVAAGSVLSRPDVVLPNGITPAPAETWLPSATTIGKLVVARHARGETEDPFQLLPLYMRPSYAEEARR